MPQRPGRGGVRVVALLCSGLLAFLGGCSGSAPSPVTLQGVAGSGPPAASNSRHLETLGVRVQSILATPGGPGYTQVFADGSRVRDDDLAALSAIERLEVLKLDSTAVGDAGLKHLSGLTGLRWLYLSRTRITNSGLEALELLRGLVILDVAGTAVGDAGLQRIAHLDTLSGLDLTGTRVTDAGLPALASLGKLEVLRLSGTAVTDAGLKSLTPIRSLKSLSLEDCPGVRGLGLQALAAIPDLQVLVLNGSPIDGEGVAAIATLGRISEVQLERTAVTDDGLKALRGLTSLRHVFLHGSRCTEEGMKALAAARPGAAVTMQQLERPETSGQPTTAAREPAPFSRTADLIYGWKWGMALTLDVLKPALPANGGAVVWIVGDSYYSRREAITPEIPWMDELLRRGYHVFVVTHGAAPKFNVEEAVGDVHRAVRFIRHNAASFGIDPDRIGALGKSVQGTWR